MHNKEKIDSEHLVQNRYWHECHICGKEIETNMQGDEIRSHTCGKIGSSPSYEADKKSGRLILDPSTADWDDIIKASNNRSYKSYHRPLLYDKSKIFQDFLGNDIHVGDKALRFNVDSQHSEFKKCVIKKIDLTKENLTIGILSEGKTKMGYTRPENLLVQESLSKII